MSSKTLTVVALAVIICLTAGVLGTILVNGGSGNDNGTYSITYELNGGIADPDSPSKYVSGEITDLGCPTNEDENLTFYGWYLDKECTENLLYIPSTMKGNLTLYALWDDSPEGHGYKLDTYDVTTKTIFGRTYEYDTFGTCSKIFLSAIDEKDNYLYREIKEIKSSDGRSSVTNTVKWASDGRLDSNKDDYTETGPEIVKLDIDGWNVDAECYTWTLKDTTSATHVQKQYYIYGWLLVMINSHYESATRTSDTICSIDSIISEDIKDEYTISVYSGEGIDATGSGTYSIGSSVTLTATGENFLGWYDGAGNLLSNDKTYETSKILSDQSFYALNSDSYDTTEDCGNAFTVTDDDMDDVIWALRDSSYNILKESEGQDFTYTFDTVGKYTLTSSGVKDGKFVGKIIVILADGIEDKTYDWSYGGKDYSITLSIRYSDYYAYRTNDIERSQGTEDHDKEFVTSDDKYVMQIAEYIVSATSGLDKDDAVNVLLRFTQTIPYAFDTESMGEEEYWKFPLETLYDNNGDCEDTSILFCAIGKAMGYDTALMLFNGHATGAINITDMGYSASDVKLKTERVGPGIFSRMITYSVINNSDISTYVYSPGSSSYYLYCETTEINDGKGNEFTAGTVPSYTGRAYYDTYSCYYVLKVIPC